MALALVLSALPGAVFAMPLLEIDPPVEEILEEDLPAESATEPSVTFTITSESGYGNWLFLPQWIPVTDEELLSGVSAVDENGDPVDVTVLDVGGLDMQSPQPQSGFPPTPYTITFEAIHPVTGEIYTTTRDVYVTVGIMPVASATNIIDLNDPTVPAGALWSYDPATNTYTVTSGPVSFIGTSSVPVTLNIASGVTVNSTATIQGTSPTGTSLLTLSGGGIFTATAGTISNSGAGSAINVTGAGTTINLSGTASTPVVVDTGGGSGNAILISNNNVKVNVNEYSTVQNSVANNGNATIQIGSGSNSTIMGTVIDVNGGSVTNTGSGYAINDSAGTGIVSNNTQINVSAGAVTAGGNSAIYSMGLNSVVKVSGGAVSNAAGNNLNPAIQMNGGTITNVFVSGSGIVASSSTAGYALQTTGNVSVSGGSVAAINGRAINLVGLNSNAAISGGTVMTTGTGMAISTATTDATTVANASVTVTGGTISAVSVSAIQITGANSSVTVSGGTVTSASGTTIYATSTTTNAKITVDGTAQVSSGSGYAINTATNTTNTTYQTVEVSGNAQVSSTTGSSAIRANSTNSSVTVSGNPQVWILNQGYAINSGGTLTLTGGFIFAYGPERTTPPPASNPYVYAGGVINTRLPNPFTIAAGSSSALIVAWNQAAGRTVYPAGSTATNDQDLGNSYNGTSSNYFWAANPDGSGGGGISYTYSNAGTTTTGFFPLTQVTVVQDSGLIFDVITGRLYEDVKGDRTYDPSYVAPLEGTLWSSEENTASGGYDLYLNGLSWTTGVPVALTIINGNANIILQNGSTNSFITVNAAGIGIWNDDTENFTGVTTDPAGPFTLSGNGTLIAIGGSSALSSAPGLPNAYVWWTNEAPVHPGTPGTTFYDTGLRTTSNAFLFDPINGYTMITVDCFAVIDNDTVEGEVNSSLPSSYKTSINLYGVTTTLGNLEPGVNPGAVIGIEANSWFQNIPLGVLVMADIHDGGNAINLTFSGIPLQASDAVFEITIPGSFLDNGLPLTVLYNPEAFFDIVLIEEIIPDPPIEPPGLPDLPNLPGWYGAGSSSDTGDYRNIEGWTASMLLSALSLLCLLIWFKRRYLGAQNRR